MKNKIIKLRDFYLFDNKLLYISEEFLGFDPLISKGLSYCILKGKCGTKVKLDEFKMGNSSFNTILTRFVDYGPLRGYQRAEIFKDGKNIINYEHGGMGYGSNYNKGGFFMVENKEITHISISTGTMVRAVLVVVCVFLVWFLRDLVLVILTAIVVASFIDSSVPHLQKMGINRIFGIVVLYVGSLRVVFEIFYFFTWVCKHSNVGVFLLVFEIRVINKSLNSKFEVEPVNFFASSASSKIVNSSGFPRFITSPLVFGLFMVK